MGTRPSGECLIYVMNAVATPMMVDIMPKDKARTSFAETAVDIRIGVRIEIQDVGLAHC